MAGPRNRAGHRCAYRGPRAERDFEMSAGDAAGQLLGLGCRNEGAAVDGRAAGYRFPCLRRRRVLEQDLRAVRVTRRRRRRARWRSPARRSAHRYRAVAPGPSTRSVVGERVESSRRETVHSSCLSTNWHDRSTRRARSSSLPNVSDPSLSRGATGADGCADRAAVVDRGYRRGWAGRAVGHELGTAAVSTERVRHDAARGRRRKATTTWCLCGVGAVLSRYRAAHQVRS